MRKIAQNVNQIAFVWFLGIGGGWDEEASFRRIHYTVLSPIMEDRNVSLYRKGNRPTDPACIWTLWARTWDRTIYTTQQPANSVH
jgi:hypothetical protein